jgi:hypothetical protein
MLRRKRQTLNELVSPQIEQKISEQVEARIAEALEERKKKLEEEIETKKEEARKTQEEFNKALDDRKKKIQEEIDLEKKKLYQEPVHQAQVLAAAASKVGGSQFESRLSYRRGSSPLNKPETPRKSQQYSVDGQNTIIVPSNSTPISTTGNLDDNIIIISKD